MEIMEIVYGPCERDLFDGPGSNHRTYFDAVTGSHFTGVETYDAEYVLAENVDDRLESQGYRYVGTYFDDRRCEDLPVWIIGDDTERYIDATVYPADNIAPEQLPVYDACSGDLLIPGPTS